MGPRPTAGPGQTEENTDRELVVFGRRQVLEALRSGQTINRLYLDRGTPPAAFAAIIEAARSRGLRPDLSPRERLETLAGIHHQGAVALLAPIAYEDIDGLLARAQERGEEPLLLLLDGVQDPQNIGSLIRTAEVLGAHGVALPERRAGAVTPAVVRAAAGAALHLPIARVKNLDQTIRGLQERGIQVVVAHPAAQIPASGCDFTGPTALVIGGEGKGVSQLIQKRADVLVRIPQAGRVESLSASVAGAVLLYEAVRQRLSATARP